MPIYDQTYRAYDGVALPRSRWWVMVQQEIRVLFKIRVFVVLLILGYLNFVLRLMQVVTFDTLASNPNNPVTVAFRNISMLAVNATMFFDFLRMQGPILFLVMILAGAGMICDDFRNNLTEIYFSKPLSWRGYVAGKVMTLLFLGLALTAVPGLLLVVLHNLLAPGLKTMQDTWWVVPSIVAFSFLLVVPCALGVLASSAMFRSQVMAGITIFMVLFADMAVGNILPELLHKPNYRVLAFPLAVNRVGEYLFKSRRLLFELPWGWSLLYVAAASAVMLWIVCRKARRAEVAA